MAVNFQSGLDAVRRAIGEGARDKKEELAGLILGKVEEGLAGPRSGRTYKIPGTDRTYTASAPGEYPAYRTGALLRSMKAKVLDHSVVVGTNNNLARAISADRPFLPELVAEAEPEIAGVLRSPWLSVERELG